MESVPAVDVGGVSEDEAADHGAGREHRLRERALPRVLADPTHLKKKAHRISDIRNE